jgi:hypothetical protein
MKSSTVRRLRQAEMFFDTSDAHVNPAPHEIASSPSAPRNDAVGRCHCERSEAISTHSTGLLRRLRLLAMTLLAVVNDAVGRDMLYPEMISTRSR